MIYLNCDTSSYSWTKLCGLIFFEPKIFKPHKYQVFIKKSTTVIFGDQFSILCASFMSNIYTIDLSHSCWVIAQRLSKYSNKLLFLMSNRWLDLLVYHWIFVSNWSKRNALMWTTLHKWLWYVKIFNILLITLRLQ